jgi:hypothetical protein
MADQSHPAPTPDPPHVGFEYFNATATINVRIKVPCDPPPSYSDLATDPAMGAPIYQNYGAFTMSPDSHLSRERYYRGGCSWARVIFGCFVFGMAVAMFTVAVHNLWK